MSKTVSIDDLAAVIAEELEDYRQEVADGIKKEIRTAGKQCVEELKATSPKRTGAYARSWKLQTVYEDKESVQVRVYNKDHYQLTHLLEDGHARVDGGRVEAKPHIRQAEKNAESTLKKRVRMRIDNGT